MVYVQFLITQLQCTTPYFISSSHWNIISFFLYLFSFAVSLLPFLKTNQTLTSLSSSPIKLSPLLIHHSPYHRHRSSRTIAEAHALFIHRQPTHHHPTSKPSPLVHHPSFFSPPTEFIIVNPRTIANRLTNSSIILIEALCLINHRCAQWACVFQFVGILVQLMKFSGVFCLQGYFKSCGFLCLWCFMYVFMAFR